MDQDYIHENIIDEYITNYIQEEGKFNSFQNMFYNDCDKYLPILQTISFKKEFLIFEEYLQYLYKQQYKFHKMTIFSPKNIILGEIDKIKKRNSILAWRKIKRINNGLRS